LCGGRKLNISKTFVANVFETFLGLANLVWRTQVRYFKNLFLQLFFELRRGRLKCCKWRLRRVMMGAANGDLAV
jgi:hypothetical protein